VGKEPIVLGAGRLWDEAKNLRTLAAVAPRLPWPVYLAGDTRDPQGNETELANAHVLGLLPGEEVQHWMQRAAIYALPARYEPFGLSALEAAQSGCALVLGDIPSLREVWGNSAAFVPPNDAAALEAVIVALIRDDKLRENMARRAQARARRYTPSAMALRYRNAYLDLITRRRNASELARTRSIPLTAGAHA
jgi:glycosyltransferase involved in cell wall biosynthesis